MTDTEHAAFVLAGLMETVFLIVSVLGLVGTIIPKQSLVQIYAYFTCGHLILNIAASIYLLYVVAHFSTTWEACQNVQAKDRCPVSLAIAKWVYFVIALIVLLIELYGALGVGHYAMQLKREKRFARRSRMVNQEAMRLVFHEKDPQDSTLHVGQIAGSSAFTPSRHSEQVYDPYLEITQTRREAGPSSMHYETPALPVEAGYGGGLWTHEDISAEEKARLKERDEEMDSGNEKSSMGPQPLTPSEALPVYTYPDPPKIHLRVDQSSLGHDIMSVRF